MAKFLKLNEPNFIWKNLNAAIDMGCIIENELPVILPQKRYETYSVVGRNGDLHETLGDYEAFDYEIPNITIRSDKLHDVKLWLTGSGQLITHNDIDKYHEAIANIKSETRFENEWGVFYNFNAVFRCQPLKRKVRETPHEFSDKSFKFEDPGDEMAKPYLEIDSNGGNITLEIGENKLQILKTQRGIVTVDCEFGKVIQERLPLFTKGDWLKINPGTNTLSIAGNFNNVKLWNRSVFL